MTDETMAVVREAYQIEEAYRDGYGEFSDVGTEDIDFSMFTETARWANVIAPGLRAAAGYSDAGHGTYTENRPVAAIKPGCEEDTPAEAVQKSAFDVFDRLTSAYRAGALDAAEGRPPDPDRVVPAPREPAEA